MDLLIRGEDVQEVVLPHTFPFSVERGEYYTWWETERGVENKELKETSPQYWYVWWDGEPKPLLGKGFVDAVDAVKAGVAEYETRLHQQERIVAEYKERLYS